jgi:hypothetical protein
MGGASSRFNETAWDQVHGGLRKKEETIDKTDPTIGHTILTLKRPNVVNQRLFTILDDTDEIIYKSSPVEGTTKDFDFYSQSKRLFRIHPTDADHTQWIVLQYDTPVWEEQVADHSVNEPVVGEITKQDHPLYRLARVDIAYGKHTGYVKFYKQVEEGDVRGELELLDDVEHKIALTVQEIKSLTAQYQSFVPTPMPTPNLDVVAKPPLVGYWCWEHSGA